MQKNTYLPSAGLSSIKLAIAISIAVLAATLMTSCGFSVENNPTSQIATTATIVAGNNFSCLLKANGVVMCWGDNSSGQLGINAYAPQISATPLVLANSDVKDQDLYTMITAGAGHVCGLRRDGKVLCWGKNDKSQTGASGNYIVKPTIVAGISNVKSISAGKSHTCFLLNSGTIFCMGANDSGQLGIAKTTTSTATPTQVATSLFSGSASAIAAGNNHSCAIRSDTNTVFCWGDNSKNQLGVATASIDSASTQVSYNAITSVTSVKAIAAGNLMSCALTNGGTVYCWGDRNSGQLGIAGDSSGAVSTPTALTISLSGQTQQISTLSASLEGNFACTVASNSNSFCWGANSVGQLGSPAPVAPAPPESRSPVQITNFSGSKIATGANHSCGFKLDGGVWCWGSNSSGQLGVATSTTSSNIPVAVQSSK